MPAASRTVPESGRPASPSLWRDRDFRRIWVGQTASQLGEQTTLVILPLIAVLTLHADAGQLGALRAAGQVSVLVFSLLAGAWVDRWTTRGVMVLTDTGRALAMIGAAAACVMAGPSLPMLLVVAFAVGSLSVFFDVAYQASLVRLVRRDQLVRANSALEGSRSAAQFGGPALGGALVSMLSTPLSAVSGAIFFVVSVMSIGRLRRGESIPAFSDPSPVWRRIHEGLRFVIGDASLRTVGLASAAFQFSFAAMMTVYLLYLPRDLHLSGTTIGLVLAATGPGALLGSLLAGWLPRLVGYGTVLVSAAALGDGAMLCVPALHRSTAMTVFALLAVNLVFGALEQMVDVTVMAVRQAATPAAIQGRVTATISWVGMGLTPLGSLLGGWLGQALGLRASLLVTVAGMMLSPVLMATSPLARLGRVLPISHVLPTTGATDPDVS